MAKDEKSTVRVDEFIEHFYAARNSGYGNTVWRPEGYVHIEDTNAADLDSLLGRELGSKVKSLYDVIFDK
jgi:hypothetical protein